MDHPSFYAITALFTPITGKKQYEITEIANDKFSEVIKFLSNSVGVEREDIYNWIVEDVIPQFDVNWNDYEAAAKENDLSWEYGLLGKDQIAVFHINDSKNPCGAHKDRHENLGKGYIGFDALSYIVHHPDFSDVPKILETPWIPIDGDKKNTRAPYKEEIALLRGDS